MPVLVGIPPLLDVIHTSRNGPLMRFHVVRLWLTPSAAGRPDNELGESRWAPSSIPTPRRSTSSPPNQAVSPDTVAPATASAMARPSGDVWSPRRIIQLIANNTRTKMLPHPWTRPTNFARVSGGIASQSSVPGMTAATPATAPERPDEGSRSARFPTTTSSRNHGSSTASRRVTGPTPPERSVWPRRGRSGSEL